MSVQRNGLITVNMSERDEIVLGSVFQYDHGLRLVVEGVSSAEAPQFHFTNGNAADAVSVLSADTTDGAAVADIPDILLAQGKNITVYLYFEDEEKGYTTKTIHIPVRERVKPETIMMELPQMGQVNTLANQ